MFLINLFTSSPLGFSKKCLGREKYSFHENSGMKASISSLFLQSLETLSEKPEEKLE